MEDIISGGILLFIVLMFALAVYHKINPKNPITRLMAALWNSPSALRLRGWFEKAVWTACVIFFGGLAVGYYVIESGWYPREREIKVYFKAHSWIEGEIQPCLSFKGTIPGNDELTTLACNFEENESHTIKVKFWGPITADKAKTWKCERSSPSMTCRLQ